MELTNAERRLRRVLRISAFIFTGETLVYLLPALIGSSTGWGQLPFVINSVVKAGLIGGVCFIASADVRRFERLVSLVVLALGIWVPAGVLILIFGEHSQDVEILGVQISMTAIIWIGMVFEGGLALGFALLHRAAFRSWHGLSYLWSGQFRTLASVAEALYWSSASAADAPTDLTPDEVAENADRYLAGFEARRKWVMRVALTGMNLYPLLFANPTFTLMAVDERRHFLERHFSDDVARRRIGSLRRWLVQGMIRLAQQATYLGYYGDPRSWPATGYTPFSQRPEGRGAQRKPRGSLVVEDGRRVARDLDSEVVIVGSGAAGAVIGYRLAEAGHRVLICERGHHVDPADFSEDEVEMLGTLYRDGALQLARDFKLQVLQGMCVGGTTVINNAVSIEPPDDVLAEWERRLGDRFDADRVRAAVASIKQLLSIGPQPARIHSPGARKFIAGIEALGLEADARRYEPIEANIHQCLGCGYCNIGCAYGRKLSMLDTLLPWAQERFGEERLRIVSETSVEGIEHSGDRVEAIQCSAGDRRFRVRGKRFVVAAGAVSSSYLLGRSGIGGPMVGRGLSFNVGSPITAEFDQELNSFAGLQITHVFEPPDAGPDVVMETWFNPVLSQALAMPGWFEQHRRNMRAYDRMAATGVLIGSESNGSVQKAFFGGADVVYEPTDADLDRLVEGLKLAGRIYLAAGARRVMPATFQFSSFTRPDDLERLSEIVRSNEDIQLGTGHPQGGNPLGREASDGPVDPRGFRVHGTANLHLCDASVFPTSLGVNPQLTTMALAECAAAELVEALG